MLSRSNIEALAAGFLPITVFLLIYKGNADVQAATRGAIALTSLIYAAFFWFKKSKNGRRLKELIEEEDSYWIMLVLAVVGGLGWILILAVCSPIEIIRQLALHSGRYAATEESATTTNA